MLIANFFQKIYNELIDFLVDTKLIIIDIFSDIHNFLNKFMSDDIIVVFMIAIGAFVAILVFRGVINKR